MTKRRLKRKSARSKSSPLTSPLVLAGLAILAVAIAFEVKTRPRTASSPAVTPQALGAPRLVVDRTEIDEGTVPLNVSVTSEFQLTNAGDVPLEILEDPDVEVVEGCWPPKAVVGSTTIKPGFQTSLSLTYKMHAGMDGPHQFDVHVKTNDPANPEQVLVVRSDWQP